MLTLSVITILFTSWILTAIICYLLLAYYVDNGDDGFVTAQSSQVDITVEEKVSGSSGTKEDSACLMYHSEQVIKLEIGLLIIDT